ncbi:hypothetical protein ABIA30_005453 [Mycobacterium sp. MAA66]|jgi:hypothetical protein
MSELYWAYEAGLQWWNARKAAPPNRATHGVETYR